MQVIMNKMKANVLVVGSGNISDYIISGEKDNTTIVPLRKIMQWVKNEGNLSAYDVVAFLGYDRYNIFKNIIIFFKFALYINKSKYKGSLMLFNTQGIRLGRLSSNRSSMSGFLSFDRYVLTKRTQSWIMRFVKCHSVNIIIPIVYGLKNGNFDIFMTQLSKSKEVEFPNKARNSYYFLHIQKLKEFVFNYDPLKRGLKVELFLYTKFTSMFEFFNEKYCQQCDTQLIETKYSNIYNLNKIEVIKLRLKRPVKNLLSIMWNIARKPMYADNKNECIQEIKPITKISPESNKFYSLVFLKPEEIPTSENINSL
jgi:hypothetical protein